MTTYRTGNHWGVTIVREATDLPRWAGTEPQEVEPDAELVAVVVNGDRALAERICALLNGEVFDEIERLLDDYRGPKALREGVRAAVFNARSTLGIAPQTAPSATETAQDGSAVGRDRVDAPGRSEGVPHRPERRGSDSEGYGRCTGCGDLWPCAGYRGTA